MFFVSQSRSWMLWITKRGPKVFVLMLSSSQFNKLKSITHFVNVKRQPVFINISFLCSFSIVRVHQDKRRETKTGDSDDSSYHHQVPVLRECRPRVIRSKPSASFHHSITCLGFSCRIQFAFACNTCYRLIWPC